MAAPSINAEIRKTLDAYKGVTAPSLPGPLTPELAKAFTTSAGLQQYNLEALHSLYPVLTPVRNMTGRVKGMGAKVEYKAITDVNTGNAQGYAAQGTIGTGVSVNIIDKTATYQPFGLSNSVTFEAQWEGYGYTDVKALAVTSLLRAVMIAEENAILFAQVSGSPNATEQAPGALGAAQQPTLTPSTTGGAITAATYYIKQTAVTGIGESLPSTATSVVVGGSGAGSIAIAPVFTTGQPIIGFKYYWSASSGGTYSEILDTDIVGGSQSNGVLPGGALVWYTNGSTITVKSLNTGNAAPPGSDGSANANAFNGIYPQMWGGTGAVLQSAIQSDGTAALTVSKINALLKTGWTNARSDPDNCFCNVQESEKITAMTLGAGTPYTVFVDQDQVQSAAANFRVGRFTNSATGSLVPVKVHPTVPQGTLLFLQSKLPSWYVPTDIPTVWERDLPQDYTEIDYPPTANSPVWTVEVRMLGSLKLYLPLIQAALYGISNQ